MEYYGNNDWRDYLAHYGVKGMKWRNHKYAKKIGDWYDYNITGQGYLRDADAYNKLSRDSSARARSLSSSSKTNKQWGKNSVQAMTYSEKARKSYANYKNKSLAGRLAKNMPDTGYGPGSYQTGNKRTQNLAGVAPARRKLKVRQTKEKAKAVVKNTGTKIKKAKNRVSKVLGKAKKKLGI